MSVTSLLRSKTLALLVAISSVVFIGIQLIRPELKNPPADADLAAPPEVKQILKNSCYDCHSNETKLSWFDQIVPAYWLVAEDVQQARQHLNFSTLNSLPVAQQTGALFEGVNQMAIRGRS